jgi:hypothetical protein
MLSIGSLVRAAKSEPSRKDHESDAVTAPAPEVKKTPRKRAPKGSVGQLVDRVLASGKGVTAVEIKAHAADEHESMIAGPSIRSHLRLGREAGRYFEKGGRWYLAETAILEKQETADPAGDQAASDLGRLGYLASRI